jgi:hypothetical protein
MLCEIHLFLSASERLRGEGGRAAADVFLGALRGPLVALTLEGEPLAVDSFEGLTHALGGLSSILLQARTPP